MLEDDFLLDADGILERVDEYSLYCFYLGFAPELDMSYRSPLRDDDLNPSWDLYVSRYAKRREFMWKDKGAGGSHGDIFRLVQLLYGYRNRYQVLVRIKSDFGLGPSIPQTERKVYHSDYRPTPRQGVDIRVKSRPFNRLDLTYWNRGNIGREILDMYNVTAIGCYWKYVDQQAPQKSKDPAYAYRVMGKYQLYFPYEKHENKFRTDMTDRELAGFQQLRYDSPLLVITKSVKDIMCLRSFGYESVSPRGESTMVPDEFLRHFEDRYEHIVTLFDNDGKHKAGKYSYPELHIPLSSGEKDPYDFCKHYGPQATAVLLQQLLHGYCPHDPQGDRAEAGHPLPW